MRRQGTGAGTADEGAPSQAVDPDAELLLLVLTVLGVESLETPLTGEQGYSSLLSLPSPLHCWLSSPLFFPSLAPNILPTPSPFLSLPVREGQCLPGNLHVAMQSNDI